MKFVLLLVVVFYYIDETIGITNLTHLTAIINKLDNKIKILNQKNADFSKYCNLYAKGKCGKCMCVVDCNVQRKYYCDCTNLKPKRDCLEFHQSESRIDGIYQVTKSGFANTLVYCDQTSNNGGWTVIQRRYDCSTDFYRNWNDYKYGFGELRREFWLGNDIIYLQTLQAMYPKGSEALFKMKPFGGSSFQINRYSHIQVGNEKTNYMLSVSGPLEGHIPTELITNNRNDLTTYDRDNDRSASNCAQIYKGPCRYGGCSHEELNLNGEYNKYGRRTIEQAFCYSHCNLESSEIKIRRVV